MLAKSDLSGSVTDGKIPLEGVTVTPYPDAVTASTDASGAFSFTGLTEGVYVLQFHLPGFVDQSVNVDLPAKPPVKVFVALAREDGGAGGPAVTVADQLNAGYGVAVTVKAQASGNGPFAYAWTQTSGPAAALTGANGDTLGFTTQDFLTSLGYGDPTGGVTATNARFDTLGLSIDQANDYGFQLVVTDANGLSTTSSVTVNSMRPTLGLRMAPLGIPVWLQGDGALLNPTAPQTTWNWLLDTSGAVGSTATMNDPMSQFPNFVPDVAGVYKVTEKVANKTLTVYGGTWRGEMTDATETANCTGLCHNTTTKIAPDIFTPWKGTKHYSALQRKMDGIAAGQAYNQSCMWCHTVGYDPSAANNGFDDVAKASGWNYPAKNQPGNWAALEAMPKLGDLAGIQCESCHGPQTTTNQGPHASNTNPDLGARIKWSSEPCASCHQESPHHYKPSQWVLGKHADKTLSVSEATVEARGTTAAHCGRCHSAQGFARYVKQLAIGNIGNLTKDGQPQGASNAGDVPWLTSIGLTQGLVESQTCQACHDPHDATNPSQLRVYDAVAALPNGMTNVSGMGAGMTCAACHNTRNGEHTDFVSAPTSYTAPHAAAQTDVMFGFNAYYVKRFNPSPHLAVADTCAGCHYAAVTASEVAAKQTANHSFVADNTICANCHSANVNGVALQAVYQQQLDTLGVAIAGKVLEIIESALLPANGAAYSVRVWDPKSDQYSSTAASSVVLTTAPTSIDHYEIHGQLGFVLHMPAPVTVGLVDVMGNAAGSIQTADLYVPAGNLKNASGATALFAASSDYVRALWNYYLLKDDNTRGIHNPGFYDAVIAATGAKVATLP
jgi:hypothetical protein